MSESGVTRIRTVVAFCVGPFRMPGMHGTGARREKVI